MFKVWASIGYSYTIRRKCFLKFIKYIRYNVICDKYTAECRLSDINAVTLNIIDLLLTMMNPNNYLDMYI